MKQGNGGPLFSDPEAVYGVDKLSGSRLGWVMMRCITSGIGAWSGGVSLLEIFLRGLVLTKWADYVSERSVKSSWP